MIKNKNSATCVRSTTVAVTPEAQLSPVAT